MKHLHVFQVVPNILVTERSKPMLRSARRANPHMPLVPIIIDDDSGGFGELETINSDLL
jgi:hypothetical protein